MTQRYLFQDGPAISGNRGDEGGWKAASRFEAPTTLGTCRLLQLGLLEAAAGAAMKQRTIKKIEVTL